jgi:hypothetical protein
MTPRVPLRFQATARDGGRVLHGRKVVAEIKRLALIHFVPQRGNTAIIRTRNGGWTFGDVSR